MKRIVLLLISISVVMMSMTTIFAVQNPPYGTGDNMPSLQFVLVELDEGYFNYKQAPDENDRYGYYYHHNYVEDKGEYLDKGESRRCGDYGIFFDEFVGGSVTYENELRFDDKGNLKRGRDGLNNRGTVLEAGQQVTEGKFYKFFVLGKNIQSTAIINISIDFASEKFKMVSRKGEQLNTNGTSTYNVLKFYKNIGAYPIGEFSYDNELGNFSFLAARTPSPVKRNITPNADIGVMTQFRGNPPFSIEEEKYYEPILSVYFKAERTEVPFITTPINQTRDKYGIQITASDALDAYSEKDDHGEDIVRDLHIINACFTPDGSINNIREGTVYLKIDNPYDRLQNRVCWQPYIWDISEEASGKLKLKIYNADMIDDNVSVYIAKYSSTLFNKLQEFGVYTIAPSGNRNFRSYDISTDIYNPLNGIYKLFLWNEKKQTPLNIPLEIVNK